MFCNKKKPSRVRLDIERRSQFVSKKHFVTEAIRFVGAPRLHTKILSMVVGAEECLSRKCVPIDDQETYSQSLIGLCSCEGFLSRDRSFFTR